MYLKHVKLANFRKIFSRQSKTKLIAIFKGKTFLKYRVLGEGILQRTKIY